MDQRPIGIFDSGVGGLTAVRALRRICPGENIIYLGDSARMPYGGRPVSELWPIAQDNVRFLLTRGVKAMIVACGTMDSNVMPEMRDTIPVPTVGVIAPTARAAAALPAPALGLLATVATIRSGVFERAILSVAPDKTVIPVACPKLASLVEHGHTAAGDPQLREALGEYLSPLCAAGVRDVVLGCTHYPLVAEAILAGLGEGATVLDAGECAALELRDTLSRLGLLSSAGEAEGPALHVTGDGEEFRAAAVMFLGERDSRRVIPTVL
jgi:glutamate racemase